MIGKPEWFRRRKYSGWGLTPKTKEGWLYVLFIVIPFVVVKNMTNWSEKTKNIVMLVWLAVILIDVIDIMIRMKKDEREIIHEAIAERNAAWFMVAILAFGLLYYAIINAIQEKIFLEPFIATALFGGVVVKAISTLYLERRG